MEVSFLIHFYYLARSLLTLSLLRFLTELMQVGFSTQARDHNYIRSKVGFLAYFTLRRSLLADLLFTDFIPYLDKYFNTPKLCPFSFLSLFDSTDIFYLGPCAVNAQQLASPSSRRTYARRMEVSLAQFY